jgi:hypothetical protein
VVLKKIILGMLLLMALGIPCLASDASSPTAVVQALYRHEIAHFADFTPAGIASVKQWITPGLYEKLVKKVNQPQPKDEVPDIDGDVFLDAQDVPTRLEVGKSSVDRDRAKVEVHLFWSSEKRKYTVLLQNVGGAWKVDDVQFEKDGMLSAMLK